jgi:hypothetical protein
MREKIDLPHVPRSALNAAPASGTSPTAGVPVVLAGSVLAAEGQR